MDATEIPSVKKFHAMYSNMDTAEIVAGYVFDFLSISGDYKSGDYVDLRKINQKV